MPRHPQKAQASDRPAAARKPRRAPAARDSRLQTALAGLAHEVRTPLNGIIVLAELLAASDLPARERGWANDLKSAAEHVASLTTVVVDGARAGIGALTPRRQPFDLAALATALGASLTARAAVKGLTAAIEIAADLPRMVIGDPVLLRATVENLLDNATKFTERGRIVFSVKAEPGSPAAWRLIFVIADDGVGMSAPELRRLFRPFGQANRTVARRYGGAGLGLAFGRQVARQMGGDLTATSAPGRGSRFTFAAMVDTVEARRPRLDAAAADGTVAMPDATAPDRALHILCAEDNPYGRVMFNTMASALGHRIDFVTSGEAAVEAVGKQPYDLILMDVTLVGMDGFEATRQIRTLPATAGIPIVGISGRGNKAEEQTARAAGMNDYLVKPVSPSALAAVIRTVANR